VAEFEGACLSIRRLMLWCIQSKIASLVFVRPLRDM